MRKILFVILICFSSISFSYSQTDDAYKAALKEMFTLSGTEETFKLAINEMFNVYKSSNSTIPYDVWNDLETELLQTSMDDLVEMLIPIYQNHFTLEDIQQLIVFYKSPIGKKYSENAPLVMKESMLVGQEWGKKLAEKFKDKMKEKGY